MSAKPVIFISYSHKDRGRLEFVQGHLQVAVANDHFKTWDDRSIKGGVDWEKEINDALDRCAAFILLVSRHSLVSSFILKKEVKAALEAHWERGLPIYPIVVDACDTSAVPWLTRMNLRPLDGRALALYPKAKRDEIMAALAREIRDIVGEAKPPSKSPPNTQLDYGRLPETPYERLVGRETEFEKLDGAWAVEETNIFSLIAEGGTGKSALVNEWLRRLQKESYPGMEGVLGWSFYSQGTSERATSADEFLNWALEKLNLALTTMSSTAKGEAIAEALAQRKILLLLDGVEPLQHGLGPQHGQLKDLGLRALLRRFAITPPSNEHGLIVLTSRLAIKDIDRWKDGAAPVRIVEKLLDEAGAALLRDNGVNGIESELRQAALEFGGHPLALGLLASFLVETQKGDIRRRDHIRNLLADVDNPGHDHAVRVMESYERAWLAGRPVLLAIMHIVGLFDRPASADCLVALRREPVIAGLTDQIASLDQAGWERAVTRLREARLLSPLDPLAPDSLDAHPLVREWFGERLKRTVGNAWEPAHGRLYEHLRDSTKEGDRPSLEDLAPLYQAIAHGCRAGRHLEALDEVYVNRICKWRTDGRLAFYSNNSLGALGSDLAAVSWFFDKPYEIPVITLPASSRSWLLSVAAFGLRALGRLAEALPAMRVSLRMSEAAKNWRNAAIEASNVAGTALLLGKVTDAIGSAEISVAHADRSDDEFQMMGKRTTLADVLHAAGKFTHAAHLFVDAERRQLKNEPQYPLLYLFQGYLYCDLLLSRGDYAAVRDRTIEMLSWEVPSISLLGRSLHRLAMGRANFGLAANGSETPTHSAAGTAAERLDEAVNGLLATGQADELPRGLLARAAFRRCIGSMSGAGLDLDEVEEIAGLGPMRLFLCDLALGRARLAFAQIEAFAPLNGMVDGSPPKPGVPSAEKRKELHDEAAKQIEIAAKLIEDCGYHRRDAELAELQSVLAGERTFASLPIHV